MRRIVTQLRDDWLLELAGLITIGAVAVVSFFTLEGPTARWIALGLLLIFLALNLAHGQFVGHTAYFAAQTGITFGLFLLRSDTLVAGILFFVLSAQAMVCLPLRRAAFWIGLFILITGGYMVVAFGWARGLITLLVYVGGYSFFGSFGKALRDAQLARQESQRLLDELRAAQSQLQLLAVADERNRLSRELHDSLGHRLTVAVVQLEGAQRLMPADPDRAARMIGAMREQLKEALADLRRTVATLRAPLEDDQPLGPALIRLAQTFQEGTGLAVHLSIPSELPPLPDAHRLALYRAAQESLTNAQRHAAADQIWLDLSIDHGSLSLAVSDNGTGYPRDMNGGGFGLNGLRERAAQLGGELQLTAGPNGGARVLFRLPLHPADTQAPGKTL